jgi:hypothetical protein
MVSRPRVTGKRVAEQQQRRNGTDQEFSYSHNADEGGRLLNEHPVRHQTGLRTLHFHRVERVDSLTARYLGSFPPSPRLERGQQGRDDQNHKHQPPYRKLHTGMRHGRGLLYRGAG